MTILLFGASGQVGWQLARALAPLGRLVACDRTRANLADSGGLERLIGETAPEVIVNAAAYTDVDGAEQERDAARRINAEAPAVIAAAAKRADARLVHYSTDYVFDGASDRPYAEDDPAGPLNVYGESKLAGEEAVRAAGCRHLILRTSWVYAARGKNFVRTVLRLAAERDALDMVADQTGAPTAACLIADVTALMLYRLAADPALAGRADGTYHLAAAGATSWHGFARFIVAEAASAGLPLRLAPDAIRPIAAADYRRPARRPASSRLDTGKLERTFALTLPPWELHAGRAVAALAQRQLAA